MINGRPWYEVCILNLLNPKVVLRIAENAVNPPLGTDPKNPFNPANQNCVLQSTQLLRLEKEIGDSLRGTYYWIHEALSDLFPFPVLGTGSIVASIIV